MLTSHQYSLAQGKVRTVCVHAYTVGRPANPGMLPCQATTPLWWAWPGQPTPGLLERRGGPKRAAACPAALAPPEELDASPGPGHKPFPVWGHAAAVVLFLEQANR